MDFHGTPLITGLILLGNLWLLVWDYTRLKTLLYSNRNIQTTILLTQDQLGVPVIWEILGLIIFVISIWFGNRENFLLWVTLCLISGLIGLITYKIYITRYKGN
jgi:hypothetical protein